MCTGRPPFRAPSARAVLKRVCEETPRPIREVNPELPPWLGELLARLHAKAPADRFASAREVADLLARRLAELQHGAPRPPAAPPGGGAEGGPRARWEERTEIRPPAEQSAAAPPPRPRPRRRTAALILMALLGGLGLGEATGITNARGTVLRLFSGDGTRALEVDDPSAGSGAAPGPNFNLGKLWPVPSPGELARRSAPADALKRDAIPPELLKKAGDGDPDRAPPQLVAIL